jgi:hypothetical protein
VRPVWRHFIRSLEPIRRRKVYWRQHATEYPNARRDLSGNVSDHPALG